MLRHSRVEVQLLRQGERELHVSSSRAAAQRHLRGSLVEGRVNAVLRGAKAVEEAMGQVLTRTMAARRLSCRAIRDSQRAVERLSAENRALLTAMAEKDASLRYHEDSMAKMTESLHKCDEKLLAIPQLQQALKDSDYARASDQKRLHARHAAAISHFQRDLHKFAESEADNRLLAREPNTLAGAPGHLAATTPPSATIGAAKANWPGHGSDRVRGTALLDECQELRRNLKRANFRILHLMGVVSAMKVKYLRIFRTKKSLGRRNAETLNTLRHGEAEMLASHTGSQSALLTDVCEELIITRAKMRRLLAREHKRLHTYEPW